MVSVGFGFKGLEKELMRKLKHKTRNKNFEIMGGSQGKLNCSSQVPLSLPSCLLLFTRIHNCLLGMQTDISKVIV